MVASNSHLKLKPLTVPVQGYEFSFKQQSRIFQQSDQIKGWLEHSTIQTMVALSDEQVFRNNVSGSIGELGVHHGKVNHCQG